MQEFDISISKTGRVRVHLKGVKGKGCRDVTEWLESIVGPAQEVELTAEHYEPDVPVRIDQQQQA